MKVRNIEEEIAKNNSRKTQEFRKKMERSGLDL